VSSIDGTEMTPRRDVPTPLHMQISDRLRSRIASGEWPPHYRLRTEPELAADLGVSRGTLRRALTTLIEEGLLVQVRGRGPFVTSNVIEPAIAQKLSSLSEDFASQGISYRTEVLAQEIIAAPRPVAALLDLVPDQDVLRLERLRTTADGPVARLVNFVRTDLCPRIDTVDFREQTQFGTLEGRYGLSLASGRRTFSAQSASPEVAAALDVPAGSPVQYLEQITYLTDGRPVEYSDVWIHSERLRVTSVLTRR
jgi:DNA-binding GntR family transcriptional regulator